MCASSERQVTSVSKTICDLTFIFVFWELALLTAGEIIWSNRLDKGEKNYEVLRGRIQVFRCFVTNDKTLHLIRIPFQTWDFICEGICCVKSSAWTFGIVQEAAGGHWDAKLSSEFCWCVERAFGTLNGSLWRKTVGLVCVCVCVQCYICKNMQFWNYLLATISPESSQNSFKTLDKFCGHAASESSLSHWGRPRYHCGHPG